MKCLWHPYNLGRNLKKKRIFLYTLYYLKNTNHRLLLFLSYFSFIFLDSLSLLWPGLLKLVSSIKSLSFCFFFFCLRVTVSPFPNVFGESLVWLPWPKGIGHDPTLRQHCKDRPNGSPSTALSDLEIRNFILLPVSQFCMKLLREEQENERTLNRKMVCKWQPILLPCNNFSVIITVHIFFLFHQNNCIYLAINNSLHNHCGFEEERMNPTKKKSDTHCHIRSSHQ